MMVLAQMYHDLQVSAQKELNYYMKGNLINDEMYHTLLLKNQVLEEIYYDYCLELKVIFNHDFIPVTQY